MTNISLPFSAVVSDDVIARHRMFMVLFSVFVGFFADRYFRRRLKSLILSGLAIGAISWTLFCLGENMLQRKEVEKIKKKRREEGKRSEEKEKRKVEKIRADDEEKWKRREG